MSTPRAKKIRLTASDLKPASSARPGQLPHKTHMRLVCLEMERYRRAQERDTLLARAAHCEHRCAEIDAEVRTLMARLNEIRPRPLGGPEANDTPAAVRVRAAATEASVLHKY
ncbi:MAG: hypothetical protein SFZ24_12150 [Planctomycetota bacterium]|nr:hypothetical protein [Planctomycetota bacterium]